MPVPTYLPRSVMCHDSGNKMRGRCVILQDYIDLIGEDRTMIEPRNSFPRQCLAALVALVLAGTAQSGTGESPVPPEQVYEWVKQLEGQWKLSAAEVQEGDTRTHSSVLPLYNTDKVAMEFKLIGRERTVQEDLLPGTKRQMVTMYHCNDSTCSAVKATHYCAKGNQPEFVASVHSSSEELIFECDMTTELCQSWDAHIHRIAHQLSEDGQHLRSVYSNFLNGEHTTDTVFHFDRKAQP